MKTDRAVGRARIMVYYCVVQVRYETSTVRCNAEDSGTAGLGGTINILPSRGGAER